MFVESKIPGSGYVFFLACALSFPLTLITTFASRVCYCYTCNVLLETKLNEIECLILNLKRLLAVYAPFLVISLVVPSIYLLPFDMMVLNVICVVSLLVILVLWIILTPKVMAISYNAKEVEKNTLLRYRLEKIMAKHSIKRYKLYCWDSSRSKESNAMVSGVGKCYLFISSCLLEELTLPELETVITHEIGHVKNNHLLKMMIGKLFVIIALIAMALIPYAFEFGVFEKIGFYFLSIIAVCLGFVIGVKIERNYESQADMYAACYNDPELFASALKKISKNEVQDQNKMDELFQSHPDIKERIEKIKKGDS